ncbi:hypothetical protein [Paracoccus sanguinis]|uniref:hypothetical protein n=1 Tax=Paracoccus sanguinis TaxID=1545044 RepID=UPI00145256BA|nr:hypothetical protein [Paracoccus sanguinis]QJD16033.1 hypothetical protein HGN31_03350 [Paracoccus sanguinis]
MLRPLACCLALPLLAACAEPDAAEYPRLMPLSELNQPPAIPAHAAEAASDPAAVGAALDARRAEAAARADAARRPVTDAGSLGDRAAALRRRAGVLAATELPQGTASASPTTYAPAPAPDATTDPAADPETAARVRALRERARALSEQPVGATPAPLPPCPPGTTDPVAARCNPG